MKKEYKKYSTPIVLLIIEIIVLIFFYIHSFSPGIAAVILAVLGASYVFFPSTNKILKICFSVALLGLCVLETHNIIIVQKNQELEFVNLSNNASTTLAQSELIQSSTQEVLNNITGGDSIPYVIPQTQAGVDPIPLVIWDKGNFILSDVTIRIIKSADFGDPVNFVNDYYGEPLVITSIHPGWPQALTEGISPNPNSSGIDNYTIFIYTQSNLFTETLNFKQGNSPGCPWAFQFWVTKQVFGTSTTEGFPVMDRSVWSNVGGAC